MSKRPCPFEDNCAPQLKIFISQQEYNKQDEKMSIVLQKKTITRLFNAANSEENTHPKVEQQQTVNTSCPECRLLKPYVAHCWFCEISLCSECVKICNFCCENFCSRCTVAIYKDGNNYTCLTCYN